MDFTDSDRAFLLATLKLAEKGLFSTTPNPRVGCILVKQGRVVGTGFHHRAGGDHAEVEALKAAGSEGARGATAYISLEPCSFRGRTGACTSALIKAGVARVVCAMEDPHPRVSGAGIMALRQAGIQAETCVDAEVYQAAAALNCGYLRRVTSGLPWVRLKMAASLDGRTAMSSGESQWITGAEARSDVQYWRARSCAIVTGVGTLLADDPRLDVREQQYRLDGILRQPLVVVLDHSLRGDPNAQVFRKAGHEATRNGSQANPRVLLVTQCRDENRLRSFQKPGVDIFQPPDRGIQARDVLKKLAESGCNEVLVEAGATLMGHFVDCNAWQEALVYLAPKLFGASARPLVTNTFQKMSEVPGFQFADCTRFGNDLRLLVQNRVIDNTDQKPKDKR